jgi:hypothetical protein
VNSAWETAFVAMSTLVGEPLETAWGSLGSGGEGTDDPARGEGTDDPARGERERSDRLADLKRSFLAPSREARAQALARALSEVALACDAAKLTW